MTEQSGELRCQRSQTAALPLTDLYCNPCQIQVISSWLWSPWSGTWLWPPKSSSLWPHIWKRKLQRSNNGEFYIIYTSGPLTFVYFPFCLKFVHGFALTLLVVQSRPKKIFWFYIDPCHFVLFCFCHICFWFSNKPIYLISYFQMYIYIS